MRKRHLIITAALSVCAGLFATYFLYQNSKTDGFDRGSIKVTQCQEEDWSWRVYRCAGDYTSGVGMMSKDTVSVTVTGDEPHKGEVVYDVYPSAFHTKTNADHFVTGKERSSVLYNGPWLLLLLVSILAPSGTALYILGKRQNNTSAH